VPKFIWKVVFSDPVVKQGLKEKVEEAEKAGKPCGAGESPMSVEKARIRRNVKRHLRRGSPLEDLQKAYAAFNRPK
jgi:hypothetical protein